MRNYPIVSIITVVLNDKKNILRTIKSVNKQNYKKIEYIIIDGQSTDGTKKIIKRNISKVDKFISAKDKGIYDALNKGIKISKGNLVYFLHSGDLFSNKLVIEKKVNYLLKNNYDFVFSHIRYYKNQSENIIRFMKSFNFPKFFFRFGIQPPHCSFLLKKKLFYKIGLFNQKYKIAGDFDFLIRLFKLKNLKYSKMDIVSNLQRSGGISDTNLFNKKKVFSEICEILKKHKIFYFKFFFILKLILRFKERIFK